MSKLVLAISVAVYKQTRLTDSQFFIARTTHSNTHVLYIYGGDQDTLHTHTHTHTQA